MVGTEFDYLHAAGTTRYRVSKRHRDCGYWECVSVEAVEGTHHFLGSINVFSTGEINRSLKYPWPRAATTEVPA